jgi:cyclase
MTKQGWSFGTRQTDTGLLRPILLTLMSLWMLLPFRPAVSKDSGELQKLADGIYARLVQPDGNAVSNSGFVVLEHCVLVFDTHFTPEAGQALASDIRSVTSKPVRYIVNSHFHPDHTHGNQAFGGMPQIISSTLARRDVLQIDLPALNRTTGIAQAQIAKLQKEIALLTDPKQKQALQNQINTRQEFLGRISKFKAVTPVVALDDSLTLLDGARRIEILYFGSGHTDGDVVLYLPAEKIAFVGDLFFNAAIPNVQDSNLHAWLNTLKLVLDLDAEQFVPGHGSVGSRTDVKKFLEYIEELQSLVRPAVERGDSLEQVIRDIQIPPKYASYMFPNFFPANVQKMYAELKALQPPAKEAEEQKKPEESGKGIY